MGTTRKNAARLLGPKPILLILAALTFICVAGLGYCWHVKQIDLLGKQMKRAEQRVDELKRRNERSRRAYAEMCSPRQLEERVRQMKLGLIHPQPDQIVRLSESDSKTLAQENHRLLAAQRPGDSQ